MARIRSVRPELRTSNLVASWPIDMRYFFVLLWGYLDDKGRGLDVPKQIAGDCFPHDEKITPTKVNGWLKRMTSGLGDKEGPICRYEVRGVRYLHAVNWGEHQRPNRPTPSKIPPCPTHSGGSDPLSEPVSESPEASSPEGEGEKGRRGDGSGSLRSPVARASRTEPEPPADGEPGPAERLIDVWRSGCRRPPPTAVINQVGRRVVAMLRDDIAPADIAEGLRVWQAKGLDPGRLPAVVNQLMNADPAPGREPSNVVAIRADPRPSTTDQRVSAALAIAERLEAK